MSSAGERSAKVAFQLGFAIVILVSSVIGNGFSGALLVRFKQLRTVQNILMANVALVHVINAIFNIPSFVTLYTKLGSPVVGPLYNLYYHLNLFSMLCMAIDRYAAIVYGIRYLTWKTTKKACLSVLLAWLLGIACSIISCATGDLKEAQDWTLLDFQRARFQSDAGLSLAAITVSMPLLMIAALTALTCYTSHKARRTVCARADRCCQVRQASVVQDMKAAKFTIFTFAACFLSYLPSLVYALCVRYDSYSDDQWFGYSAALCPFLLGVVNPLIHLSYSRRFRHAVLQLCKMPCGKARLEEIEITVFPRPRNSRKRPGPELARKVPTQESSGGFRLPFCSRKIHPAESSFSPIDSSNHGGKAVVIFQKPCNVPYLNNVTPTDN